MDFFSPTNIHMYIAIGLSLVNGALLCVAGYKFFQIIQLSGYKIKGYFTWLKDTKANYVNRIIMLCFLSVCGSLVVNCLFDVYSPLSLYSYIGLIFYFYFTIVFCVNLYSAPKKVPLKNTRRMTRLNIAAFIFISLISFVFIVLSSKFLHMFRFGAVCLTPLLLPIIIPCVHWIMVPIEELIKKTFVTKAKKRLSTMPNLIKIGITGSFGKTSTKYILNTILREKYSVCMSPHSFNTTTGLCKVVNDYLKDDNEVLIAEMGARNKGDISKICNIIQPKYAIITGVGTQHLHTFKTVENIANTKFELIDSLPKDGVAVFNGDNEIAVKMYDRCSVQEKYLVGTKDSLVKATRVRVDNNGTHFSLQIGEDIINCNTKLMGRHNVENISLCVQLAKVLGLTLDQIKKGIEKLEPVAHRLELIENDNGVLVLDDSYNASVEGSTVALEVLAKLGNKKIVVTPGLVELGTIEKEENFNFGVKLAGVADYVIIVNKVNSKSLRDGLLSKEYPEDRIILVDTLEQAKDKFSTLISSGDVILLENDLPDNYI